MAPYNVVDLSEVPLYVGSENYLPLNDWRLLCLVFDYVTQDA